jgi:hypothetical protein
MRTEQVSYFQLLASNISADIASEASPRPTPADRLARLGFETSKVELVTPVAAAARLFGSAPDARMLALAADGVRSFSTEDLQVRRRQLGHLGLA